MLILSAGGAMAQDAEAPAQETSQANSSGWGVQCNNVAEDELRCAATMTITSAENNQAILSISLQEAPADASPTLIVQLPFGLDLPRGIDLVVDDGASWTFEISTCLQTGCFVVNEAEQEMIDAMIGGGTLGVAMRASNGAETRMNVTLSGFSRAFERLE
ncbi:invasion associated locus B family protein [Rhodobacteraceae bacterium ASV31]|nr:invasion associated locus B family protein [Anianabacter salinae]